MTPSTAQAERIYRAIFDRSPSPRTCERFVAEARALWDDATPQQRAATARALELTGDLEALELACRVSGAMPLLRKLFVLMMYLGEAEPGTEELLVNDQPRPATAYVALSWAALRSSFKLARGGVSLLRLRRQEGRGA